MSRFPCWFKGNSPVGLCFFGRDQIDPDWSPAAPAFSYLSSRCGCRQFQASVARSDTFHGRSEAENLSWDRNERPMKMHQKHGVLFFFCCFDGSYKSWKLVGLFNLSWIPRSSRDSSLKEAGEWCKVHRTSWNKAVTIALVHWTSHVEVATTSFRNTNVPSLLAHHNHVNRFSRNTIGKYASTAVQQLAIFLAKFSSCWKKNSLVECD